MADANGNGHKPRFDYSLNVGTILVIVSMIGTAGVTFWGMSANYTKLQETVFNTASQLNASVLRVEQKLDLTVMRLDQRDGDHDRRLQTIERRLWREQP